MSIVPVDDLIRAAGQCRLRGNASRIPSKAEDWDGLADRLTALAAVIESVAGAGPIWFLSTGEITLTSPEPEEKE